MLYTHIAEQSLDWNEIIGKEARGTDNVDLGQVKAAGQLNVMTRKGTLVKETHYFPKYMLESYDGQTVRFKVSEEQLKDFETEKPPVREDYSKYQQGASGAAVIPVLEERLQISKTNVTEEVVIVKEPVIEYKLIHVPIVREEIKIIRRPAGTGPKPTADSILVSPSEDREIRIQLNREEVEVTKRPRLFEEMIIRKERVAVESRPWK